MNRIGRLMVFALGLWAGTANAATGKSAVFPLDLTEGERVSAGSEKLTYSNLWDGDADASVSIAQDGAAIFSGLTGEGVETWTVDRNGRYVLTHTTYTNGAAGKVETAVFVVEGKEVPVRELVVEWESGSFMYDNTGKTPGVTAKSGDQVLVKGADYTVHYEGNTNAGTAKAILTGLPPYVGSVTNEFTIAKRTVELTSGTASKSYDGTPLDCHSVTTNGDGFVAGEGVDFTFSGSQTTVGSSKNTFDYTFKAGTQAGNYTITKIEGDLVVVRGEIINPFDPDDPYSPVTPEVLAKANCITNYDGEGHAIEIASLLNPLVAGCLTVIEYSLDPVREPFAPASPTFTNVVTTSVWYRITTSNYKPFTTNAVLLILPRSITNVSVAAIAEQTYTGSDIEPVPSVTDLRVLSGEVEPTDILTSADYDLSYLNNTNVGTAKIVLSGKNNYEGSQTNTFQIVPAIIPPGPTGAIVATGYTNVYDGAAHGVTVVVSGLKTTPTVQYKSSPSADWQGDSPTCANVCDTQVWWKVSAPNYQPVEGTIGLKIEKRPVTLNSGTKLDFAYDGQPHELPVLVKSENWFVEGEGITTSNWATVTTVAQGNVDNTFDYEPLVGTDLNNYQITVATGRIAVVKGTIGPGGGDEPGPGVIPESGFSKFDATYVYDGEGHTINTQALYAVTLTGSTPSFSFSLDGETGWQTDPFVYTNVGEYVMWYKIAAPNYEDYKHQAKVTIEPLVLTVTLDANGGSCSMASKTVTHGATYGTLATPTWAGHIFAGWYTAASGGDEVKESTTVNIMTPQTLYAHWVSVKSVSAKQRYPWNGRVDIVVAFEGESNDVSKVDCSFIATNSATKAELSVASITRKGVDSGKDSAWSRRFVWNAGADVGTVKIDDVVFTVAASIPLGCVQLWENGPYWAECNIGATKAEEFGYYFWWGDTVGYRRNADDNGWISAKDSTE